MQYSALRQKYDDAALKWEVSRDEALRSVFESESALERYGSILRRATAAREAGLMRPDPLADQLVSACIERSRNLLVIGMRDQEARDNAMEMHLIAAELLRYQGEMLGELTDLRIETRFNDLDLR